MTPFRWLTLLLSLLALTVFWPLWPALLLASWTATLTRPLLSRFERGLKGRRRAAAALSLLLFVALALPLALMAVGVISGAQELLAMVKNSASATSALESLTAAPDDAAPRLPSSLSDLVALAQRAGTEGLGMLTDLAGAAARALIGLFLYFGGAYALLLDSSAVWNWLKAHVPVDARHLDRLGAAFHETGRGLLLGVGLTALTQGLAATAIYFALGVPRAWVLGPITGIASVIPFVGTALVWAPISLGLLLTDRPIKALVLVVLGIGVIGLIDNLLRPIYARLGALQMPMFLLFGSVFGGLAVFGTWGALIGPLIVRLAIEALTIAREEPR